MLLFFFKQVQKSRHFAIRVSLVVLDFVQKSLGRLEGGLFKALQEVFLILLLLGFSGSQGLALFDVLLKRGLVSNLVVVSFGQRVSFIYFLLFLLLHEIVAHWRIVEGKVQVWAILDEARVFWDL